eukprot:SAG31_NODE_2955_length_4860_cov_3.219072_1_plen_24_part_10
MPRSSWADPRALGPPKSSQVMRAL